MFTETTIILLGLFVACEICTLIVFCYQRTVRKLSLRLKLPQSSLNICYPSWMLAMYWATFSKYAIALALLIIDWRCALVAAGMFVLFFLISACISVPDGTNLIRIYKEVKKRGSGALRTGVYQALISEIEKGIVATGGDLAKLNKMENEDLEWTSKTHMTHGHMWHANDNNSSQTNGGYSCFTQGNESDLMNDLSVKRHKEILESKDIRKYLELYEEAPTPVKISVVIWGLWVIVGLVLGFVFEESIQSNIGTAFVNVLFIAAVLRGSRWVRNFYAIGVLIFAILVGVNSIFPDSFIDDATSISIIINVSIAIVYVGPLFAKSAQSWFYGNRKDAWDNKCMIKLVGLLLLILLFILAANIVKRGENKSTGIHKAAIYPKTFQASDVKSTYSQQRHAVPPRGERTVSRTGNNMPKKVSRTQESSKRIENLNVVLRKEPRSQRNTLELDMNAAGAHASSSMSSQAPIVPSKPLSEWTDEELDAYAYLQGTVARDKKDYTSAREWFEIAAKSGHVDSMVEMGTLLYSGEGGRKDAVQAASWYRRAANKGSAEAMVQLGSLYLIGDGVDMNQEEGISWMQKAARKGYADAREFLLKIGRTW